MTNHHQYYSFLRKMSLTKQRYSHIKNWRKSFPNNNVDLVKYWYKTSWKNTIDISIIKTIEKSLSEEMTKTNKEFFPYPSLVFNAFKTTSFEDVKVVFIGQDPYPNYEEYKDRVVPQGMGLCFSVADEMRIPASLKNIYENLYNFNHISKIPISGNLTSWAQQGCLMINATLSVISNEINSHEHIWKKFTDNIIKYISDNKDFVIFVIWGKNAFDKLGLIDLDKHDAIISSHPSPNSFAKSFRSYNAFKDCDHFGSINNKLKEKSLKEIDWKV